MKVDKAAVVEMLVKCGITSAEKWSDSKMEDKINDLHKAKAQLEASGHLKKLPKEETKLFKSILAAIDSGEKVRLAAAEEEEVEEETEDEEDESDEGSGDDEEEPEEEDEEVETTSKAKAAKNGKPAAKGKAPAKPDKAKADKKTKPARKESTVERDGFGSAAGSIRYKVHAAISQKPQSVEEVAKRAKVENKLAARRLRGMVKVGFAKRDGDGKYSLSKEGLRLQKAGA